MSGPPLPAAGGAGGPTNVLVVAYWRFDDPLVHFVLASTRVMRGHLPEGSRIFLFAFHPRGGPSVAEAARRRLAEEGITVLWRPYRPFGTAALLGAGASVLHLVGVCVRRRVHVVHAWCAPAGALGYVVSLLTGLPLVIDSFEPHAEVMAESGIWRRDGPAFRILLALERRQASRAAAVIAVAKGMRGYAAERYGVVPDPFLVKPSPVDLALFDPGRPADPALRRELGLERRVVCVYAGKLGGKYLDEEIFCFFAVARRHWGERFRALFLTATPPAVVAERCARQGLAPEVVVTRFVEHREVSRYMRLADFALNPVKPIPSNRYCTSVKDGEYWAMGLPVVIPPGIGDDSDIVEEEGIGVILRGFADHDLQRAVEEVDQLLHQPRHELAERIRAVAVRHRSFDMADRVYGSIYGG